MNVSKILEEAFSANLSPYQQQTFPTKKNHTLFKSLNAIPNIWLESLNSSTTDLQKNRR